MQRFRWIALQGSSRGFLTPLLLIYFITTSGIPAHAADDPTACRTPVARIVSIQGSIEVLPAHQNDWSKVTRLDTLLCEGDRLRTGPLSRAALFIQPETLVRVAQNTNISVSQTAEETLVEFRQEELLPAAASAYTCGAGYFITRFPRKFRVKTPHLNAAVEGTEFLVAMRCESTELSVFEGKVLAAGAGANVFPAQSISSGQVLTIGGSEPPAVKLLVKPADAVQWVLYYPPLSDAKAEADLPPAEQCRSLPKPMDQTCLTQRAEVLLRLGRVEEAQREVDEAVALDPGTGDANALRAIISIARNDKAGAMEAATAATTASPNSARAWLALSYAQQASFKLEDSLVSARKAQNLEPNSSVTNARVAELLMSLGRIKEAAVAARAAVDANPAESRAHTILGFVHLAQIKTKEARTDFLAAIERDSSDPLPRLGLGLAIIRDGKLADGREQLEIAVALDPTNSLLRSYVGKAYYEENSKERDQLAAGQFDLAKQLDPNDPTPWFYGAILKQARNDPVAAIADLNESIARNDGRAIYRSRLMLDQDQASRSANLARIYREAGYEQLALSEAYKSLASDPQSYGAHQFLAEAYEPLPRLTVARESERLQASLLAPIGQIPISPFRGLKAPFASGQPRPVFVAPAVQPGQASFNSYEALFEEPGATVFANGILASQDTQSGQAIVTAASQSLATSFGYQHFDTAGFDAQHPLTIDSGNVFFQWKATPQLHLQLDAAAANSEYGIVRFGFDPLLSIPQDIKDSTHTMRIGARYQPDERNVLLLSGVKQSYEQQQLTFGVPSSFETDGDTAELQYGFAASRFGVTAGVGHLSGTTTIPSVSPVSFDADHAYVYGRLSNESRGMEMHFGGSYVNQEIVDSRFETSDPKLGLSVRPTPGMNVRVAYYQTSQRPLVANQTLEPTQFDGFNQLWDDPTGTSAQQSAFGLDLAFGSNFYVGGEIIDRTLDIPVLLTPLSFETRESFGRVYLYKGLPKSTFTGLLRDCSFGLSAQYIDQDLDRSDLPADGIAQLHNRLVALALTAFPSASIALRLNATYVRRDAVLLGTQQFDTTDEFWSIGGEISYVLPRRGGRVSFGISNATDMRYEVLDFDPAPLPVPPQQVVYGRLSLTF